MSDGDAKPAGLEVGVPANDAPARRRFRDAEIDRILRTAAELQERSHQVAAEAGRGLTLEELRQIATEAGIDPRFVDAAASQSRAPVKQEGSGFAGGPYSWHYR